MHGDLDSHKAMIDCWDRGTHRQSWDMCKPELKRNVAQVKQCTWSLMLVMTLRS